MSTAGLLLAAGAGSRMGMPKALVHDGEESWLARGVQVLRDGGCDDVTVVLGAAADEAMRLLDGLGVDVAIAADWAEGMSASLRAGLAALPADADAAVVLLVDLPDVTPEVVRRVVAAGAGPGDLARASYDGRPGHPVLLGRAHWPAVRESAAGDHGARDYLASAGARAVECGDLATGRDVDSR
ncbi:nucleotidyltransferase family protein [Nocardioides sp. 503]|uniref:nucleotidyltransferase family protein n=1 Tax=Nocardioides sp. 503 TaxID=2508326 RepID=UPI001430AD1E|nr:nucleotidyltransferase family protein [Nocardioides sp. 503]